jgi:acyl-CoA reductase-like NAD-dependent aldehyde dehydrogenase
MADEQAQAAERAARDAERARATRVRERRAQRDQIVDLERQRADLDARIGTLRAEMASGPVDESAVFEVMVDSLGALGEHVKGDIIRPGDAEYDFAWLHSSGAVRRLSADEVRLLEQRPMASATRPLASDGSVDLGAQAGALDAFGVAAGALDAEIMADDLEADRAERAEAARAGEVVVRETTDMGPDTPKEPAGQAKPTTGGRGR